MGSFNRFVDTAAYCTALVGPLLLCGAYILTTRAAEEATESEVTQCADDEAPRTEPVPQIAPTMESVDEGPATDLDIAPEDEIEPKSTADATSVSGLDFAFVVDGKLLVQSDAPTSWTSASIETPREGGSVGDFFRVDLPADVDRLPNHLADLVGATVDLYGSRGKMCAATVTGFHLVAELNGEDFDVTQGLGVDFDAWTVDAENAYVLLERVWQQENRWLVADFQSDDPDACDGAVFGRAASLPAPRLLTASRRNWRDVPAASRSEFRRHAQAELAEFFTSYLEEAQEPTWKSWDEFYDDTIRYTVFVDGNGAPVLARALMGDRWSHCGDDFGGRVNRYYGLQEDFTAPLSGPDMPLVFVDIDGDGRFEIIGDDDEGRSLYAADGEHLRLGYRPFMGCPC